MSGRSSKDGSDASLPGLCQGGGGWCRLMCERVRMVGALVEVDREGLTTLMVLSPALLRIPAWLETRASYQRPATRLSRSASTSARSYRSMEDPRTCTARRCPR